MKALQYIKSVPRYVFVRTIGHWSPKFVTGPLSSIRMANINQPELPTSEWLRIRPLLSGICGSDLTTIQAKGSPYFSPLISAPFVMGHEVVGEIIELGPNSNSKDLSIGDRVVIEPGLCCIVRGIDPPCSSCQEGNFSLCEMIMHGDLAPGIQTGYCRDTGGGWSSSVVAHPFQVHKIPVQLSDEEAVLVEPFSCCLHAALQSFPKDNEKILIIGCGAIGLLTIAALRALGARCQILAAARYPHQQTMAANLGADLVVKADKDLYDIVRKITGAEIYWPEIGRPVFIGGTQRTFDCVGSSQTIDDALRLTGSGGDVTIVGMPGIPKNIDWTAIWYKELKVKGSYAYGSESYEGDVISTFDLAIKLLNSGIINLKPLVTDVFALKDYRKALELAMTAGQNGSVKVVFDFRPPKKQDIK